LTSRAPGKSTTLAEAPANLGDYGGRGGNALRGSGFGSVTEPQKHESMSTLPYDDRSTLHDVSRRETTSHGSDAGAYRPGPGVQMFIWLAWSVSFAFWVLSLETGVGILKSLGHAPAHGLLDALAGGGLGYFLMDVVGVAVLGLALAYGLYRYNSRDRGADAVTEASTSALYDAVERAGGDDVVERSPDARRPEERDAYRPA
jgi:hypothetical protein